MLDPATALQSAHRSGQGLPNGTVTLLFTDIEGSTELLQRLKDAYPTVLAEQEEILRFTIDAHGGQVVDTQGDSLFAAFPRAVAAVNAAVAAQRAFASHAWREDAAVRVRMGLHTGEPSVVANRYVGIDVHRAARIGAAGHGGQVLLSQTTRDLVEAGLPEGVTLRDWGEHRLKDLRQPKHLYQLMIAGLPSDFAPLNTLDTLPNNLPLALTSFIGRERAIAEVNHLLAETRLLTLIGPGGTGKTRLALQVAAETLDAEHFKHGVWLVELAPVAEAQLVPQTVAAVLGVREVAEQPITTTLMNYLRSKNLLLLLDNCEHLIDVCAQLADTLLRACPEVRILATSREALGISGETTWRVPILSVPKGRDGVTVETLTAFESTRLFIDRALAAQPSFTLTESNTPFVIEICERLDGIPLAIELAAARVKVLSPQQIAARLDDRFRLLTGGSRTALPRQQTLRALIDWSYDLLPEVERVLLRRLSVFAGGWTLESAEAVGSMQKAEDGDSGSLPSVDQLMPSDILDLLVQLLNKSLVTTDERNDEMRYRMLETIRQYAQEKLIDSGEATHIRDHHLDYFVEFVEGVDPELRGTEQETWLRRLDNDYDNIRAALEWSSHRPEVQLGFAASLWRFWRVRSYFSEGRRWLEGALARASDAPPLARAKALIGAASLANYQADYARAIVLLTEASELSRQAGDQHSIATSLNLMAHAQMMTGNFDQTRRVLDESLTIFKKLGDKRGMSYVYFFLGSMYLAEGELSQARQVLEQSLALMREVGDRWWIGNILLQFAWAINQQGDHERALALFDEVLEIGRSFDDKRGIARALMYIAEAKFYQRDYATARNKYIQALRVFQEIGDKWWGTVCLEGLAAVFAELGDPERVARLLAAAEHLHEILGAPLLMAYRDTRERTLAYAQSELDSKSFKVFWEAGRGLTFTQAIELAVKDE